MLSPQQLGQPDVDQGHQCQRCQEMLAELTIGDPRAILNETLEGERVDQDRLRTAELDVVCAGILQGQAAVQGMLLDLKREERRPLQLAETPFVRVRNEGDAFGLKHPVSKVGISRRFVRFRMRDQKPAVDKILVEAR